MNIIFTQQILWSSLIFPALGRRDKEKNFKPAEKIVIGSKGAKTAPLLPILSYCSPIYDNSAVILQKPYDTNSVMLYDQKKVRDKKKRGGDWYKKEDMLRRQLNDGYREED